MSDLDKSENLPFPHVPPTIQPLFHSASPHIHTTDSTQIHSNPPRVPDDPRIRRAGTLPQSPRTTHRGRHRRPSRRPGDDMRGHTRAIPRPDGAVPGRRRRTRHQLPIHGGLRRPGVLQPGILPTTPMSKSPVPGSHHADTGEP